MIRTTLLSFIGLFSVSCVMPGDIEALAGVQREALVRFQQVEADRQEEILEILEDESRSVAERDAALATVQVEAQTAIDLLLSDSKASAKDIVDTVKDRTAAMTAVAKSSPLTGNPLIDLLLAGLLGGISVPASTGVARRLRQAPPAA
jgi:hypothetical protein